MLYQGSGQHHIAEVMLGEIGRPPGPEMEHYIDRESYALAAGLAFGLVTLGKGNDMIGLVSTAEGMSMADQLCHYMLGGHKRPLTALQREKYKTPSYQIREGDCINADVTSPGATLALGMMFFNTNNEAVAQWFKVPDTLLCSGPQICRFFGSKGFQNSHELYGTLHHSVIKSTSGGTGGKEYY